MADNWKSDHSWNDRERAGEVKLVPLVREKLKVSEGLFFGEDHSKPAMKQVLTKLLPVFKESGVGTVSIELTQGQVEDVIAGKKTRFTELLAKTRPETVEFIRKSDAAGFKVIGHEVPAFAEDYAKADALEGKARNDAFEAADKKWLSPEGMKTRDDFAAATIEKHAKGKRIVVGGEAHGSNLVSYLENSPGNPNRSDVLDTGMARGLSEKLGIPSFSGYYTVNDSLSLGLAEREAGPKSLFAIALPDDLQQGLRAVLPEAELHAPVPVTPGMPPGSPKPSR